ncbi:7492_t:CDS:2, partial [Gigaspora margarita]
LRHDEAECIELLVEFRKFICNEKPYKAKFDSQKESSLTWCDVSIVPSQMACERNFSILKWFYGDQRNRLSIKRIESMAKLRMYWLSEIRTELEYYGENLTEEELRACANMATIPVELSSEDDMFDINDSFDNDEYYIINQNTFFLDIDSANSDEFTASETKLDVEDIADLTLSLLILITHFRPQPKPMSSEGHGNMDFEASDIVDKVLGIENINI